MNIINIIVTGLVFIAMLIAIFIPRVFGFPTSIIVAGLGFVLLGLGRYLHHKSQSSFINDSEFFGLAVVLVGWLSFHGDQIKQITLAQQG